MFPGKILSSPLLVHVMLNLFDLHLLPLQVVVLFQEPDDVVLLWPGLSSELD